MRGNKGFRQIFFICILLITFSFSRAQQVGINILYPDSSAILHVESHEKGFLWPRMSTSERDAIPNPAHGLTIFNTEDSTIQYWNNICWLNVYQKDCADCYFNITANAIADTIDRTITDSTTFTLTIDQNAGNPQNIAFTILGVLPSGMTVDLSPNPLFSSGSIEVIIHVTPFTPTGTYPVIVQTLCGSYFRNIIFSVTLTPCYLLNVNNSVSNYSGSVDLYSQYPSAPTNSPVCMVVNVDAGVDVTSVTAASPAFTTGNLPSGSVVAIVNNGNILGRGGNGGRSYDPVAGTTGGGFNGGDAINLTAKTTIQNNFNIYGGGGGGSSAAISIVYTFSIPLGPFGSLGVDIGIVVGAGGGGGAGGGLGGTAPGLAGGGLTVVINYYSDGMDGITGQLGIGGQGGFKNLPYTQSFSFSGVGIDVSIVPNAIGGDGGAYGFPGGQGVFQALLVIDANVFGVSLNLLNVDLASGLTIPPGGAPGYAVRRNGNVTNIPDNTYNTSFLKGVVGN